MVRCRINQYVRHSGAMIFVTISSFYFWICRKFYNILVISLFNSISAATSFGCFFFVSRSINWNMIFKSTLSQELITGVEICNASVLSVITSSISVLTLQTYLVDAEVLFLCGRQTLESYNFKINGKEMILEIHMKTGQDNGKKLIRMIGTAGEHYGNILKIRSGLKQVYSQQGMTQEPKLLKIRVETCVHLVL